MFVLFSPGDKETPSSWKYIPLLRRAGQDRLFDLNESFLLTTNLPDLRLIKEPTADIWR